LFARVLVLVDVGSVEEGERVALRCSRFGVVGDQGLSGCSVQRHALVAKVEVADVGVVERLAPSVVRADVVAVPESGELGTFMTSSPTMMATSGESGSRLERARRWVTQPRSWPSQSSNKIRALG